MYSRKHTATPLALVSFLSLTFGPNASLSSDPVTYITYVRVHICYPCPASLPLPSPPFSQQLLCVRLAALHSLFDVVSRSSELQSLATLSVISRPAVSLASIDSC